MSAGDDTYEGWSNRETWCANLWLANDYGLYRETLEMAHGVLYDVLRADMPDGERCEREQGLMASRLERRFEEWAHGDGEDDYVPPPGLYKVLADVGSLYRVDWREIASSWLQDAREQ